MTRAVEVALLVLIARRLGTIIRQWEKQAFWAAFSGRSPSASAS